MSAKIKSSEIRWSEPIKIKFGFTGLSATHAVPIIRELIQDSWPEIRRAQQCVYVIRLKGQVAVAYGEEISPVIYIGEGDAYARLYSHAKWISTLVVSVPNVELEIHIAEVARKNLSDLYKYIEADLIEWFRQDYQQLPWFNRQRETSKTDWYDYEPDAKKELRSRLGIGSGSKFLWAIRPTHNNDQFESYSKGKLN
jgi:hypothetical protein